MVVLVMMSVRVKVKLAIENAFILKMIEVTLVRMSLMMSANAKVKLRRSIEKEQSAS